MFYKNLARLAIVTALIVTLAVAVTVPERGDADGSQSVAATQPEPAPTTTTTIPTASHPIPEPRLIQAAHLAEEGVVRLRQEREAEEVRLAQERAEEAERARIAAATTTTTTAPPPPPTTTSPAPTTPPPPPPSSVGAGACGGDLPPCYVLQRESGGDPRIWNGGCHAPVGHRGMSPCGVSSASGLWQFVRGTWGGYGGYVNAADAPASVQNERARQLWAGGQGCGHWSAC